MKSQDCIQRVYEYHCSHCYFSIIDNTRDESEATRKAHRKSQEHREQIKLERAFN